ncbi:hypothetical protein NAPIS_ORF01865 [Vairimorpha apis BRL 01]|uniref:Uncharacterized protein n=1 Tax=Vairimorpha apis BRL 01 TaxID=1037528 RepID=T0KZ60_9MICR|nr:hypothetical protein NAPIS_ORF01865 [Vairimorpha apis BRL 01]
MNYNYILSSFENIGSSLLFGTSTKILYKVLNNNLNLYTLKEALQNGCDMAKYSLIFSSNYKFLHFLGLKGWLLNIFCVYLTSFCVGLRNGVKYARANGLYGILTSIIKNIFI